MCKKSKRIQRITSLCTFFIFLFTTFLIIPPTNVKAYMKGVVGTEPKLSDTQETPTKGISTNTNIKIKFNEDMDLSTLKLTGKDYIALFEIKNDGTYTSSSLFPSDLDKSYNSATRTLTLNTSKYLQKGCRYKLSIVQNFMLTSSGDHLPPYVAQNPLEYYFTTELDNSAKVSAFYFSKDYSPKSAGEPLIKVNYGEKVPGAFKFANGIINEMFVCFSKEMNSTTVNPSNVLLKDKNGKLVSGYSIDEDPRRQPGRRYIISTDGAMDQGLNPYTLTFTEDVKDKDGTRLDTITAQICKGITMTSGKKAAQFEFIYDSEPYKIESASITQKGNIEGDLLNSKDIENCIKDVANNGCIKLNFDEKIELGTVKIKGSFILPETLGIYRMDNGIENRVLEDKLSYSYDEKEDILTLNYNLLDPAQLYKLKISSKITDYCGNKSNNTAEFFFRTEMTDEAPAVSKIYYKFSSLGESKYVTDPTQDINKIVTKSESKGLKIFFNMGLDCDTEFSSAVRVFDKDLNLVTSRFDINYNNSEYSFSIIPKQYVVETENPYYIAFTENIKGKANGKNIELSKKFGAKVETLSDGTKAMLLPFNIDINPPTYTVLANGETQLSGEMNPVELNCSSVINIEFNERMTTNSSLYGIRYDASNIELAVYDEAIENYVPVNLSEAEYEMTPTSVTLKPNWKKYGLNKVYRLNMKEFKLKDLSGWNVTEYTFAFSWFKITTQGGPTRNSVVKPSVVDFNVDIPKDVETDLYIKGNQLIQINYDFYILQDEKDYLIDGSKFTLKKEFLTTLKQGKNILVFKFDKGLNCELTVNVIANKEILLNFIDAPEYFKLGDTAEVKLKVFNKYFEEKDVTLIMAIFDNNNKMIKCESFSKQFDGYQNGMIEGKINTPKEGKYKIKCFVWDNMNNMNPLMKPAVFELK